MYIKTITNKNVFCQDIFEKKVNYNLPSLNFNINLSFVARGVKEYTPRLEQIIGTLEAIDTFLVMNSTDISDKVNKNRKGKIKNSENIFTYSSTYFKNCGGVMGAENFFYVLRDFFVYNSSDFVSSYKFLKDYSIEIKLSNLDSLLDLKSNKSKTKILNNLVDDDVITLRISLEENPKNTLGLRNFLKKNFNTIDKNKWRI